MMILNKEGLILQKAKENLNWEPKVDLESGLTLTIDWIKKRVS